MIDWKTKQDQFRKYCKALVGNPMLVCLNVMVTLFCLFGLDLGTIYASNSELESFDAAIVAAIAFFSVEILVTCVATEGYFLSFLFALDVIATATLYLELSYVSHSFFSGLLPRVARVSQLGVRLGHFIRAVQIFERILGSRKSSENQNEEDPEPRRIDSFRLSSRVNSRMFTEGLPPPDKAPEPGKIFNSHVGRQLEEITAVRVIALVILLMFVFPALSVEAHFWSLENLGPSGLQSVHLAYAQFVSECQQASAGTAVARTFYESELYMYTSQVSPVMGPIEDGVDSNLGWLGFSQKTDPDSPDPCLEGVNGPAISTLTTTTDSITTRLTTGWGFGCFDKKFGVSLYPNISDCPPPTTVEYSTEGLRSLDSFYFTSVFDQHAFSLVEARLSIYRTLSLWVLFALAIFVFSKDAFELVLKPIERMMVKVEKLRLNPLMATQIDDNAVKQEESLKMRKLAQYTKATNLWTKWRAKRDLLLMNQTSLETIVLEKTIVRIGGLLALGFGQAGAEIVAHNMDGNTTEIQAMVTGRRIEAIFGFLQIQNFSVITSVLQDKVMVFVNQICEIVHGIVDEYHGISNRSSGDSFLVVWKLEDHPDSNASRFHDMAVSACLKINIAINRSLELAEYQRLPLLMQKIPKFRVQLRTGLHRGWGIEGAIGSNLKIDPSYMSPDVNVAEFLSGANEEYGTHVLVADTVTRLCSGEMKNLFRPIDRIKLESALQPLVLHSIDLDLEVPLISPFENEQGFLTSPTSSKYSAEKMSRSMNRHRQRIERERRKLLKLSTKSVFSDLIGADVYLGKIRKIFTEEFFQKFKSGYLNYLTGEWQIARVAFEETASMLRREESQVGGEGDAKDGGPLAAEQVVLDGPSLFLLEYMRKSQFVAPANWGRVHRIEDKQIR